MYVHPVLEKRKRKKRGGSLSLHGSSLFPSSSSSCLLVLSSASSLVSALSRLLLTGKNLELLLVWSMASPSVSEEKDSSRAVWVCTLRVDADKERSTSRALFSFFASGFREWRQFLNEKAPTGASVSQTFGRCLLRSILLSSPSTIVRDLLTTPLSFSAGRRTRERRERTGTTRRRRRRKRRQRSLLSYRVDLQDFFSQPPL